jgi:predicted alpha/beta hydrolase family esterase
MAFAFACSPSGGSDAVTTAPAAGVVSDSVIPTQSQFKSEFGSFGPHFRSWLSARGYNFSDGGFGGYRANTAPSGSKRIIVFVHGNGSRAQGSTGDPNGWYNTYKYLRERGWNNSELFAVNYAYDNILLAAQNDHRSSFTNRVKDFINAVYSYTGKKVTIVAHSLGVTVSRKAMKDGNLYGKVETFVAISGANHGLPTCGYIGWWGIYYEVYGLPTCSASTGFHHAPNYHYAYGSTSNFIGKLNSSSYGDYEMRNKTTRTYVIMSTVDELAGVRATYTQKLAGAYKTKTYSYVPYGHFNSKDLTASVQYAMINRTY